jgi:hypothetical protein
MNKKKIIKITIISLAIVMAISVAVYFLSENKDDPAHQKNKLSFDADTARVYACREYTAPGVYLKWGYPIPLDSPSAELKKDKVFRVFFYSMSSAEESGKEPGVLVPELVAEFDSPLTDSYCKKLSYKNTEKKSFGPRYSPEVLALDFDQLEGKQNDYYIALDKVSQAYFTGANDNQAAKTANDFLDQFLYLAEPGLKQFYLDLNPGFWDWLEQLTGRNVFGEHIIK